MAETEKPQKTMSDVYKEYDLYSVIREGKEEANNPKGVGLRISRGRPKRQPRRQPKLRKGFGR